MKNHVLRPLWVVIGAIALILLARHFMVPSDFGVNGESFTYGFHRAGNIDDWKAFPVKYRGKELCRECHSENYEEHVSSPHAVIECENCHGPALNHPDNPESLDVDTSRLLCLRCHAYLPYPTSQRSDIAGIDPLLHNPNQDCSSCHNPHNPDLEEME